LHKWKYGDVATERTIVTEETHSSPQMGAHPQEILNERVFCLTLISSGVSLVRALGQPRQITSVGQYKKSKSCAAGKLAMLYFSHVPVDPNSSDETQWAALQEFKEECKTGGLYAGFSSRQQLQSDVRQHLTIELNRPQYRWLIRASVAPWRRGSRIAGAGEVVQGEGHEDG
jgi:hypothetical protein